MIAAKSVSKTSKMANSVFICWWNSLSTCKSLRESVRSLWMCITITLFKRDWVIVVRKYVLILRWADELLSETKLAAGIIKERTSQDERLGTKEELGSCMGKHRKCLHTSQNVSDSPEHSISMQLSSKRKPTFLVSAGVFPVGIATIHEGILWPVVFIRTTR